MEKVHDRMLSQGEKPSESGTPPFAIQSGAGVNSLTFGNFQPPQGQVMKLRLPNVQPEEAYEKQPAPESQVFGTHIREAIAIVKDWKKKSP